MATFNASVKVLPAIDNQPPERISHLPELCAYLNDESTARESHDSAKDLAGEGPPRKRQRLSEYPCTSFDSAELQTSVVLASIDLRMVSIIDDGPVGASSL
jgi:hypothetical protein